MGNSQSSAQGIQQIEKKIFWLEQEIELYQQAVKQETFANLAAIWRLRTSVRGDDSLTELHILGISLSFSLERDDIISSTSSLSTNSPKVYATNQDLKQARLAAEEKFADEIERSQRTLELQKEKLRERVAEVITKQGELSGTAPNGQADKDEHKKLAKELRSQGKVRNKHNTLKTNDHLLKEQHKKNERELVTLSAQLEAIEVALGLAPKCKISTKERKKLENTILVFTQLKSSILLGKTDDLTRHLQETKTKLEAIKKQKDSQSKKYSESYINLLEVELEILQQIEKIGTTDKLIMCSYLTRFIENCETRLEHIAIKSKQQDINNATKSSRVVEELERNKAELTAEKNILCMQPSPPGSENATKLNECEHKLNTIDNKLKLLEPIQLDLSTMQEFRTVLLKERAESWKLDKELSTELLETKRNSNNLRLTTDFINACEAECHRLISEIERFSGDTPPPFTASKTLRSDHARFFSAEYDSLSSELREVAQAISEGEIVEDELDHDIIAEDEALLQYLGNQLEILKHPMGPTSEQLLAMNTLRRELLVSRLHGKEEEKASALEVRGELLKEIEDLEAYCQHASRQYEELNEKLEKLSSETPKVDGRTDPESPLKLIQDYKDFFETEYLILRATVENLAQGIKSGEVDPATLDENEILRNAQRLAQLEHQLALFEKPQQLYSRITELSALDEPLKKQIEESFLQLYVLDLSNPGIEKILFTLEKWILGFGIAASVGQIAGGAVLTIFSGGALAVAGGGLISSGIDTGIFAVSSLHNSVPLDKTEYLTKGVADFAVGVVTGALAAGAPVAAKKLGQVASTRFGDVATKFGAKAITVVNNGATKMLGEQVTKKVIELASKEGVESFLQISAKLSQNALKGAGFAAVNNVIAGGIESAVRQDRRYFVDAVTPKNLAVATLGGAAGGAINYGSKKGQHRYLKKRGIYVGKNLRKVANFEALLRNTPKHVTEEAAVKVIVGVGAGILTTAANTSVSNLAHGKPFSNGLGTRVATAAFSSAVHSSVDTAKQLNKRYAISAEQLRELAIEHAKTGRWDDVENNQAEKDPEAQVKHPEGVEKTQQPALDTSVQEPAPDQKAILAKIEENDKAIAMLKLEMQELAQYEEAKLLFEDCEAKEAKYENALKEIVDLNKKVKTIETERLSKSEQLSALDAEHAAATNEVRIISNQPKSYTQQNPVGELKKAGGHLSKQWKRTVGKARKEVPKLPTSFPEKQKTKVGSLDEFTRKRLHITTTIGTYDSELNTLREEVKRRTSKLEILGNKRSISQDKVQNYGRDKFNLLKKKFDQIAGVPSRTNESINYEIKKRAQDNVVLKNTYDHWSYPITGNTPGDSTAPTKPELIVPDVSLKVDKPKIVETIQQSDTGKKATKAAKKAANKAKETVKSTNEDLKRFDEARLQATNEAGKALEKMGQDIGSRLSEHATDLYKALPPALRSVTDDIKDHLMQMHQDLWKNLPPETQQVVIMAALCTTGVMGPAAIVAFVSSQATKDLPWPHEVKQVIRIGAAIAAGDPISLGSAMGMVAENLGGDAGKAARFAMAVYNQDSNALINSFAESSGSTDIQKINEFRKALENPDKKAALSMLATELGGKNAGKYLDLATAINEKDSNAILRMSAKEAGGKAPGLAELVLAVDSKDPKKIGVSLGNVIGGDVQTHLSLAISAIESDPNLARQALANSNDSDLGKALALEQNQKTIVRQSNLPQQGNASSVPQAKPVTSPEKNTPQPSSQTFAELGIMNGVPSIAEHNPTQETNRDSVLTANPQVSTRKSKIPLSKYKKNPPSSSPCTEEKFRGPRREQEPTVEQDNPTPDTGVSEGSALGKLSDAIDKVTPYGGENKGMKHLEKVSSAAKAVELATTENPQRKSEIVGGLMEDAAGAAVALVLQAIKVSASNAALVASTIVSSDSIGDEPPLPKTKTSIPLPEISMTDSLESNKPSVPFIRAPNAVEKRLYKLGDAKAPAPIVSRKSTDNTPKLDRVTTTKEELLESIKTPKPDSIIRASTAEEQKQLRERRSVN